MRDGHTVTAPPPRDGLIAHTRSSFMRAQARAPHGDPTLSQLVVDASGDDPLTAYPAHLQVVRTMQHAAQRGDVACLQAAMQGIGITCNGLHLVATACDTARHCDCPLSCTAAMAATGLQICSRALASAATVGLQVELHTAAMAAAVACARLTLHTVQHWEGDDADVSDSAATTRSNITRDALLVDMAGVLRAACASPALADAPPAAHQLLLLLRCCATALLEHGPHDALQAAVRAALEWPALVAGFHSVLGGDVEAGLRADLEHFVGAARAVRPVMLISTLARAYAAVARQGGAEAVVGLPGSAGLWAALGEAPQQSRHRLVEALMVHDKLLVDALHDGLRVWVCFEEHAGAAAATPAIASGAGGSATTALHPWVCFADAVGQLGWSSSVLLDFVISDETCFLEYLLRLLKLGRSAGWTCTVRVLDSDSALPQLAARGTASGSLLACLGQLRATIQRLHSKGLFPFNPAPLLRLMDRALPPPP